MNNEHNPIAQLVSRIQQKWITDVSPYPECGLVRWLIEPEQSRLYEGFLRLESSEHGQLPDLFVTLITPFHSEESYSAALIGTWLETYDKEKATIEQVKTRLPEFSWDVSRYRKVAEEDRSTDLFLDLLKTFFQAVQQPRRILTVALMPHAVHNIKEYERWLKKLLQTGIPEHIRFCIFDYTTDGYFDHLFRQFPELTRTLKVQLDLDGAVSKIVQAGDVNDPAVQLRKYITKMSDAVNARNMEKLDHLGKACIGEMTGSKVRSLMATAYIVYAGMLFHFKRYEDIGSLLQKGLAITEKGISAGDEACRPLLSQYYGFIGSNYQLSKKELKAVDWFHRQARLLVEQGLPLPAISAYRQAAWLSRRHEPTVYKTILIEAWNTGRGLKKEEVGLSDYSLVGLEYYDYLYDRRETEAYEQVDQEMTVLYGREWKNNTRERLKAPAEKEPIYVTGQ